MYNFSNLKEMSNKIQWNSQPWQQNKDKRSLKGLQQWGGTHNKKETLNVANLKTIQNKNNCEEQKVDIQCILQKKRKGERNKWQQHCKFNILSSFNNCKKCDSMHMYETKIN